VLVEVWSGNELEGGGGVMPVAVAAVRGRRVESAWCCRLVSAGSPGGRGVVSTAGSIFCAVKSKCVSATFFF
jgi:hypothetical protein